MLVSGQTHSQALRVVGSVPRCESGLTSELVNPPGRGRFRLKLQCSNAMHSLGIGDATNTKANMDDRQKGRKPPASAPATHDGDFATAFVVE